MSGHTLGPWQIRSEIVHIDIVSYHNGWSAPIASLVEARFVEHGDVALYVDEVNANARLIASAPDLLAACQRVLTLPSLIEAAEHHKVGERAREEIRDILREVGEAVGKAEASNERNSE
jgi:hypothetical protein